MDREREQLWELRFNDPLSDAETLQMGDNRQINKFGEGPEDNSDIEAQYIGLIKVRDDHIRQFKREYRLISDGGEISVETTSFIQHLIDVGWMVRAVTVFGK